MKKFLVGLISTMIFVPAVIAQKSKLTMNLKQGQEYKQVTDSKIMITQEINDQKIEMTMDMTGQLSFLVRSVNTDGFEMDVKYDRLGFTLEMPQGTAEFSSEKNDIDDIFSSILKVLKDKPFRVTMTKNGKIAQIADVDLLWGGLIDQFSQITEAQKQQIKTQIMNAYGEKAFKGSIEMITAIFPDKPVRKGAKWTIKTKLESGMSALMTT